MTTPLKNPIPPGAEHFKTTEPHQKRERDQVALELEANLKQKLPSGKKNKKKTEDHA